MSEGGKAEVGGKRRKGKRGVRDKEKKEEVRRSGEEERRRDGVRMPRQGRKPPRRA